jgi:hypothetical protein
MSDGRPMITVAALRQWLPVLARRTPHLVSAYLLPGRVPASMREATMLGFHLGQPLSSLRPSPRRLGRCRRPLGPRPGGVQRGGGGRL